jgi:predicted nucleotidyltransferase
MGQLGVAEILAELTERIRKTVMPDKIYLFGSYAWGTPHADSDIDLFIIIESSDLPPYQRAREIYRSFRGMRVPVEVLVRTRDEVAKSRDVASSLTKKILEQGKLLYG